MEPGGRIAERWLLLGTAPGSGRVERWRVQDPATGAPAEALILRPPIDPALAQAFLDAHRTLQRTRAPGLVHVLQTGWVDERPFAIRAPLDDDTLAQVQVPLPPDQVAALGAYLFEPLRQAGATTAGGLRPADIALTTDGLPMLAPLGALPEPVRPDDAHWAAPEAFQGARPSTSAALYGLGAVLSWLATGDPPPSRPADSPKLPASLREAVARLTHRDPARRAEALPLLEALAGALPKLATARRGARPATLATGTVRTTQQAPRTTAARIDHPIPGAALVIPASDLRALAPSDLSLAAGHAGLPLSELDHLIGQGLPLILAESPSSRTPSRGQLPARLPLAEVRRPGLLAPLAAGSLLLAALVALVPVLGGGLPAAAVVPLVLLGAGLGVGVTWNRRRLRWRRTLTASRLRHGQPRAPEDVRTRQARIAQMRRELGQADLPAAAEMDLRSALRDVEHHLSDLERLARVTHDALGSLDAAELRARLSSIPPQATDERQRLGRTLGDVESVERRQADLAEELERIDTALAELSEVLGRSRRPEGGREAIDKLRQTTRLTNQALKEPGDR